MKPTEFSGQSIVLQKPSDMTNEQCSSLPILHLDGVCISCWTVKWSERLKVLITGKVWLGVRSGQTQPPVYLTVDQPFRINHER